MINPVKVIEWLGDMAHSLSVPAAEEDSTMWRRAVRAFLILLLILAAGVLLWATGVSGHIGIPGPAYADEIDTKIEAAIAPLAKKQEEMRRTIDNTNRRTIAILRGLYAERIRAKVRQRCAADTASRREDLIQQINRLKREFERLSGKDYGHVPGCNDV